MNHITTEDIVFRPHYLGYLIALGSALGVSVACLTLAARQHPAWLVGAILAIGMGLALASRYSAGTVIIRGLDLVFCSGVLTTRERSLPIWEARLEIRQSLLGRMLDAGTIIQQVGDARIIVRVAQISALRRLIAQRKLWIFGQVEALPHGVLVATRPSGTLLSA